MANSTSLLSGNAKGRGSRSKSRRMLLDSMRALLADTATVSSIALVNRRSDDRFTAATQTTPSEVVGSSSMIHSMALSSSSPPAPTAVMVDTLGKQKDLGTVFQEGVVGPDDFMYDAYAHSPLPFTFGPYAHGFESGLPEDLIPLPGCSAGGEDVKMDVLQMGLRDVDWTAFAHDSGNEKVQALTSNASSDRPHGEFSESHHAAQSSHTESTTDNDASSRSPGQPRITATRRLQRRATDESVSSSSRSTNHGKPYRAHSAIERKYRAALQDRFQALRDVVAQWRQEEIDSGTDDWEDVSVKLNKSGVLAEAVECIHQLKEENDLLFEQLGAIMDTVKQLRTEGSL